MLSLPSPHEVFGMIKKTTIVNIRFDDDLITKLNQLVSDATFENVSSAVRELIHIGLLTLNYKQQIKDPEFVKSVDELKQNDNLFNWIETLNQNQQDALFYTLKMTRENRYEQARLR
jgi:Arc/MetJ-type ribon-helix-helix transcriptional regulator